MNSEQALSKRQQKKLQQVVKLIEANQPSHSKPRKKRKLQSHIVINPHTTPQDQPQNLHQTKSTYLSTPLHDKPKEEEPCQDGEEPCENTKLKEEGLNLEFQLPDNDLASFLIVYQYNQNEKLIQKQQEDLSYLDEIGEPLIVHNNKKSAQLCQKLDSMLKEVVKGKEQLFSRQQKNISKVFKAIKLQSVDG